MIILNIFEAHCLTMTAGPNLTTIKEKTQSKSYFYDSLSEPLHFGTFNPNPHYF
jgi:hypothetical protein